MMPAALPREFTVSGQRQAAPCGNLSVTQRGKLAMQVAQVATRLHSSG